MSENRRVVWSEGMLLSPQHFQQSERALIHATHRLYAALQPFAHGFTELAINLDALRNGRIALTRAAGVLPDGTPFSMPGSEPLPAERMIAPQFEGRSEVLPILLGMPLAADERPLVGEAAKPGTPGPRYSPEFVELGDAHTRSGPRKIALSHANPALLFPGDATGEYSWLALAEVVRTPEGGFALREEFIPPLLQVRASDWLMRMIGRRLEKLVTLGNEIAGRRSHRGEGGADFASTDTKAFWRLHMINSTIPLLAHLMDSEHRQAHPEEAYRILAQLAGQLCAHSSEKTPKDIPPYRHADLRGTFGGLETLINELEKGGDVKNYLSVPLTRGQTAFSGQIVDERLVDPATRWYVGVRCDLDETRAIVELPAKFKIASNERIETLVAYALSGLRVRHERVPPSTLPVRKGFLYFEVEKRGDEWDPIAGARDVAVYLPPDVPSPEVELWGILR